MGVIPLQHMNPDLSETQALQQAIRREKVLRARAMTEEEKLVATLDQIELAFEWMLEGVKQQFPDLTEEEAHRILAERLDRQRGREDRGLFVAVPTETSALGKSQPLDNFSHEL